MPNNKKKGKQQGVKAATAQTNDDFDDMLAEVCATDLTVAAVTGVSTSTMGSTAAGGVVPESAPATASSSSSSSPARAQGRPPLSPAALMMGRRISDEVIMAACERGDLAQMR
jgi:hypothetical protein